MQEYLEELNEQQRRAVLHNEGPLMIVAGAGSGKTKVLTTRIAHLMNQGVDAFRILALTFTNKAAKEMKERIERILYNQEARNLYIGTFHSVFARILRAEAGHLGYPHNFTIYDSDDAKSLIKTILKELNLDPKDYKPKIVAGRISSAKNNLYTPEKYLMDRHIQKEDERSRRGEMGNIYKQYVERCFKNGAMDFDDLLVKMYELLTQSPEMLAKYQQKFKYILIDEYQDTNTAQYKIIKLLAARHENICVVGDDAQSIYSFRGATIENILRFKKDYPNTKVIKLEQNYRSTENILNAANTIISNNKDQIPKNLWTQKEQGEKIKLVRTITDNDEGKFVADAIAEQKLRNHYKNSDFAILYRTNAQSRSFEENLRRKGISYRILGGLSFYQRKEIKDFVAYLRILVNPKDEEAIKRVINYPARGIGNTTQNRIALFANQNQITYWKALHHAQAAGVGAAATSKIEQFILMIKSLQTLLEKKNAYEVAFEVGKLTGLVRNLHEDKSVEGLARYENLQELLNAIKEYTELPDENGEVELDKSLGNYLQQITLLTDADKEGEEGEDVVKLMTIHAAKGLEFPCVFAVGLEENIFPSTMSLYDRKDLEEERRLFYVVITRAEERLWITFAGSRYRFGSLVNNDPSRFIEELPEAFVDKSFSGIGARQRSQFKTSRQRPHSLSQNGQGYAAARRTSSKENTSTDWKALRKKNSQKNYGHVASADFLPSDPEAIEEGMRIEHQKFGFGVVQTIEGRSHNRIARIEFEQAGEKRIMLNYAKLMIVEA